MPVSTISFISEGAAKQLNPASGVAIISITNPGDSAHLQEGWEAILRVEVADASYDEQTIESFGRMWHLSSFGFPAKDHALRIRSFLDSLSPSIHTLIVHCGAGVSRSGAVAKYASKKFGRPFPNEYQRYNEALYRLLENPTAFDEVLARYPARKPSLLQRIVALFRSRPCG